MYAQLGHDGPPTFPWTENLLTGTPLPLCPLRQLQLADPDLREEVLRWKGVHFPLFLKGHLLVSGGISEQPSRWLDAMLFLEQLEHQQEAKLIEIETASKD